MSEDMTYDAEPTRADLRTRVAELERENAELRGKLDAVPVGAISAIAADAIADAWNRKPLQSVNAWLKTQVQP